MAFLSHSALSAVFSQPAWRAGQKLASFHDQVELRG
jgi:hypothetical protein